MSLKCLLSERYLSAAAPVALFVKPSQFAFMCPSAALSEKKKKREGINKYLRGLLHRANNCSSMGLVHLFVGEVMQVRLDDLLVGLSLTVCER